MRVKVQLKQIASYSKGTQINGDKLVASGVYDYLNGGIAPSGKWNEFNTPGGTITISEGGNSCGFVNYMREPFWCGAHCYYLFDTLQNSEYLYYALKSQQERLMGIRTGACMPNIKKADLGGFELTYDTDEQQQEYVVSVLKRVESIIEARQQQIAELDNLVQARFVEMFGSKGYPESNLIDLIVEGAGLSYGIVQPGDDGTGDMGVLRPVDFANGRISMEQIKYIDRSIGVSYKRTLLDGHELLITVRGSTGITALTDERLAGMNVTCGIAVIRYNEQKIDPVFLNGYLNTDIAQDYIKEHTKGATLKQINIADLRVQRIPIPPMELQKKYSAFIRQTDKSKFAVKQSIEKLETLKRSLMQQYFG